MAQKVEDPDYEAGVAYWDSVEASNVRPISLFLYLEPAVEPECPLLYNFLCTHRMVCLEDTDSQTALYQDLTRCPRACFCSAVYPA